MHKTFLDESHERAVLRAMSEATNDLLRRRGEQSRVENETVEVRLEQIEKRLALLELK
ncbi:MAG: hypothetical protein FWG73_02475 [Planctomycetaceae bacterium]|nr:hypothetical protein [Planctomycetaceae bacterium]